MTLYALDGIAPTLPEDGDCWIAPDARVIGRVTLSRGVGVWFGCTLRGDNEPITIGENTNLQENVVGHNDIGFPLVIGAGCTIGHNAIVHGCTIGDNTLVGMGATIMNGARVGNNCLIGAGALVTEGKVIPDNSMVVGCPGKVVRELDAEAIAGLRRSCEDYLAKMRRYRAGLSPVAAR